MKPLLWKIDRALLDYHIGGNAVSDYLWFAALAATAFLLVKPLTAGVARLGSAITGRFSEQGQGMLFRSMITRPLRLLLQTILLYAAVNRLEAPFRFILLHRNYRKEVVNVRFIDVIDHIFIFCCILFVTLLVSRIIDFIFRLRLEKAGREGHIEKLQIVPLLREVIKLLLWATCFFTMLGIVFHVNVPALITGLGIGGVAIALAGKETVENLFASFTILVDKPFRVGDVVRLGTFEGTAERIGFRSTRLRSMDGSMYIIPNKKLIDDNLENLTRRDVRRMRVPVMIKYGLSGDALRRMTGELEAMLRQAKEILPPTEVAIENFGENIIQLTISYYVAHPLDTEALARIRQEISLRIFAITSRYAVPPPAAPPPAPGNDAENKNSSRDNKDQSNSTN